jgi:hypothetical protein
MVLFSNLVAEPSRFFVKWANTMGTPGFLTITMAIQAAAICVATSLMAQPVWLACTAWGGSHTGRYTFRVDARACRVYWKELDTDLEIQLCKPPRIRALKPFAANRDFFVTFNLSTGVFADHANGRADRGSCAPMAGESKVGESKPR